MLCSTRMGLQINRPSVQTYRDTISVVALHVVACHSSPNSHGHTAEQTSNSETTFTRPHSQEARLHAAIGGIAELPANGWRRVRGDFRAHENGKKPIACRWSCMSLPVRRPGFNEGQATTFHCSSPCHRSCHRRSRSFRSIPSSYGHTGTNFYVAAPAGPSKSCRSRTSRRSTGIIRSRIHGVFVLRERLSFTKDVY